MILIFTTKDDNHEHLILENKIEVALGNGFSGEAAGVPNTVWINGEMILDPNETSEEKAREVFDEIVNSALHGNNACDVRHFTHVKPAKGK